MTDGNVRVPVWTRIWAVFEALDVAADPLALDQDRIGALEARVVKLEAACRPAVTQG